MTDIEAMLHGIIDTDALDEIEVSGASRDFAHLEMRSYRRLARSQAREDAVEHPALVDGGHAFAPAANPFACPFATPTCATIEGSAA